MRRTYVARPDDHWQAYCRGWRAGRFYRRVSILTPPEDGVLQTVMVWGED